MTTSTNLLNNWQKNAYLISSHLNIIQKVSRKKVSFIYDTLLSFFGQNFFEVKPNFDTPIEKINWLFSLLSNKNHIGCIGALFELANLIQYSKTLDISIQKEFQNLKKSPQNLRTFFFELFIYNLLDKNQIQNKKKSIVGRQVIEGSCIISNTEYLFECRKVFMPKIKELDIIRRLGTDFWQYGNTMNKGLGMICTINLRRPLSGRHRSHFEKRIKEYFEAFNKLAQVSKIDYFVDDEFGEFKAFDYDEATLIEVKELQKYDILFSIIPTKIPILDQPNMYNVNIICNFSVYRSKIYEKFESILREKKDQHRNSPFKNKILFIDSETLPEFQMGLFQNENAFEINKVKAIYDKLNMKETVCLIRRKYLEEYPNILVDILSKEHNNDVIKTLKTLFE